MPRLFVQAGQAKECTVFIQATVFELIFYIIFSIVDDGSRLRILIIFINNIIYMGKHNAEY